MIIEAVIAAALLATALISLAKLSQSSAMLNSQADGRLAATLAAQNVIARIGVAEISSLDSSAKQAASEVESSSGCKIDVATSVFETGQRGGVHLQVIAKLNDQVSVQLHRWYLEPLGDDKGEPAGEDDGDA